MSVSNPILRDDRERFVTVGAAQTLFGPFDFKIYDTLDVEVYWRATITDAWQLISATVTLTGSAPSGFTVLKTGLATGSFLRVRGRRIHERITDVTRQSVINSQAIERQFDLITIILQEVARDAKLGFSASEQIRQILNEQIPFGSIENAELAPMPAATVLGAVNAGENANLSMATLAALLNINRTLDAEKPVSTAQGAAIAARAPSRVEALNPNVQGWNISFNLFAQTSPNYYNGMAHSYTLDENAQWATNGWLLNLIVEAGYNQDIVGNATNAPVAVAHNVGMQVKKPNAGNDFWPLLGVLDIQTPGTAGTGGQALAGIVRGNWQGQNVLADGVRAQAENYTGRPHAGFIAGSSQTGDVGQPFDNAWYTGFHCLHAKEFGFRVGGPQGGANAIIPAKPYVLQTADGSQDVWRISFSGGSECVQYQQGTFVLASSVFPVFQMRNTSAGLDRKNWQFLVEADGSYTIRTLNDAENSASTAVRLIRTGLTPAAIEFPIASTTAAAANAVLDAGNNNRLLRSTSSAKYKHKIEPLDPFFSQKVLELRPVWYRSKAEVDPGEWSYYGLIAEDVAKVDPRLVFWGYQDDQYEPVEVEPERTETIEVRPALKLRKIVEDENGKKHQVFFDVPAEFETRTVPARVEMKVRDGEKKRPDGVQYERLAVLLIDVVRRQHEAIAAMEQRLSAIEQRLAG